VDSDLPYLGNQYKEYHNMAAKALTEGMRIEDGFLVIVKKLNPMRSKSGKSTVIASSRGRETFVHEDKSIQVNLNAYILDE
jgi:hypothetical protein